MLERSFSQFSTENQSVQVEGHVQPWQRRLQPCDHCLLVGDPREVAEGQVLQVPVWDIQTVSVSDRLDHRISRSATELT